MKYNLEINYVMKNKITLTSKELIDSQESAIKYGKYRQTQFKAAIRFISCGILTLRTSEVIAVYFKVTEVEG